jgi:endonuclease YncB( thermonuclease family)
MMCFHKYLCCFLNHPIHEPIPEPCEEAGEEALEEAVIEPIVEHIEDRLGEQSEEVVIERLGEPLGETVIKHIEDRLGERVEEPTQIKWSDTIIFIPNISGGYVIKVYDGDTITIAQKLPYPESPLYRFSVRLAGIDSPEMKGKSTEEKVAAKLSQKALEEIILNKNVTIKNVKTEKYGRLLADVYYENIHLNKWMLDNNYAIPYNGGTKKPFVSYNPPENTEESIENIEVNIEQL